MLYTDIVDSIRQLESLGDTRWRSILDVHDDIAGRLLEVHGGKLVKSTGDGVLATFDGPGRGIRFATRFLERLGQIG